MKRLLFLGLLALPMLASAQLQFQPKPVSAVVYPGNPLSLPVTVSGTAPMPVITATLRYGQGGLVALPADQPSLITLNRTATISWAHYSAQPSVQYLEIGVNGMTQIAVTIQATYNAPQVSSPTSITVNPTGALPITISLAGGGSGGISLGDIAPLLAAKASRDSVYAKTASDGRYKAIGYVPAWSEVTGKPGFFSGSYLDLTNRPTIPTVPTLISAFTNDAGYLTSAYVPAWATISGKPAFFSGAYIDLTGKPVIPVVPTVLSGFTNDAGYLTPTTGDSRYLASSYVPAWATISGKPSFFSGAYTDLTGKPFIPSTATDVGAYTTSQTDNLLLLRLPVSRVANKAALLASATGAAHWIETDLDSDFGTPSVSLWDGTKLLTFPTLTR